MKRILIVGTAGVGKTVLAGVMGEALRLPVYHLDKLGWLPGWVRRPADAFGHDIDTLMHATDAWVMEGNYNQVLSTRLARVDTLVLIDLPLWLCLIRVFRRWWLNRGGLRQDLPAGCPEPFPWTFLLWLFKAPPKRQRFWVDLAATMPHLEFHHLTSCRQVEDFKKALPRG